MQANTFNWADSIVHYGDKIDEFDLFHEKAKKRISRMEKQQRRDALVMSTAFGLLGLNLEKAHEAALEIEKNNAPGSAEGKS